MNNNIVLLLKLLWTISTFFRGDMIYNSLLCPSLGCNWQTADVMCRGTGCTTEKVSVTGSLCWSYFTLRILPCDMYNSYEYIYIYVNGVYVGTCNPTGSRSDETWYNCGNYYHGSSSDFSVYLRARSYISGNCYNSNEGLGYFTVYGRVYFKANNYAINSPSRTPTRSPSTMPTEYPTRLPTLYPTVSPTSLSPTYLPTASPCINKQEWCLVAEIKGLCYDQDYGTRMLVTNECPVSCGTCFNSTLSPTVAPTLLPTLAPTSPTFSPSRKPSMVPTHNPSVMPTSSPTCTDTYRFCGVISTFCNSSLASKAHMANHCAASCGLCTLQPTQFPTAEPSIPCKDAYAYCPVLARSGGCYQENHHARIHFQSECPVSCGTCNNKTVSPTSIPSPQPTTNPTTPTFSPSLSPSREPTLYPTRIPTMSPTCVDTITYCSVIESYCKNADPPTLSKMLTDCAATCGFCTLQPSRNPTTSPSIVPTGSPSADPMLSPSTLPTMPPTMPPSNLPSSSPSISPTKKPSQSPAFAPTTLPTTSPLSPTVLPSHLPTVGPTLPPSKYPSKSPSLGPTESPSLEPSAVPSNYPTLIPTTDPSISPTQCEDLFVFCSELASSGACYDDDYDTRNEIHRDCPVSCGTCNNNTISPTASPSIMPSAGPTEQPSPYPSEVPTLEPTCADLVGYCGKILRFCSSVDPVKTRLMKTFCAASCGLCTLQPSSNLSAIDSTNSSSSTGAEEPGYRRRGTEATSSTTTRVSLTVATDETQVEVQSIHHQFHNVWFMMFLCAFAALPAVIWKCVVLKGKVEIKNQGDFVRFSQNFVIGNDKEISCF